MRRLNRFMVLLSVVVMASGVLFAEEDIGTDSEDAVRVLRLLGGRGRRACRPLPLRSTA